MKINELPSEKIIKPPERGWKSKTFYLVRISWRASNPLYPAIFYSSFLENNEPVYGHIFHPYHGNTSYTHKSEYEYKNIYAMEVIRELYSENDFKPFGEQE